MRALLLALTLALPACEKDTDTGEPIDADGDGFDVREDCDDRDPLIYPGSFETCDGRDEDCDGQIDEDVTVTLYRDEDLDGWGNAELPTTGCPGTGGYSTEGTDCDDGNDAVHPEAEELCDGVDNDCDGTADEDVATETWYPDEDLDGWGDPTGAVQDCVQPGGYIAVGDDCDDGDDRVNPGADERCNGVDDDCDGATDEDDAVDAGTWYPDADGDGYGNAAADGVTTCAHPSGYVADHTDCDDFAAAVNPGAQEVCDEAAADEDCDGLADDLDPDTFAATKTAFYPDSDGDGWGATGPGTLACTAPSGTTTDDSDCDDADGTINPAATEACDARDNDCDGLYDDDDPSLAIGNDWYADADGDNYGDVAVHRVACLQPTGYVADASDCDDTDPALTTDCGGDTGDTAEPFTRDGTYEGDLTFDVLVPATGLSDTCSGTVTLAVVTADATPITGTGSCTFAGPAAVLGPQTGALDGVITADPDAAGNVWLGTLVTDTWVGTFPDDDTLEGAFDGVYIDASGTTWEYAGTFTAAR